jgi:hypothetical protein
MEDVRHLLMEATVIFRRKYIVKNAMIIIEYDYVADVLVRIFPWGVSIYLELRYNNFAFLVIS